MSRKRIALLATAAAGCLALSACSGSNAGAGAESPFTPEAVEAAEAAALDAAGGEELGGSVSIMGVLGGEELDDFVAVLEPFQNATGIEVKYEGTRDFGAVLQTRLDGGNPPELAATPALGLIAELAAEGDVVDLRPIIGDAELEASYDPGLLATATVADTLFGVFNTVNVNGLLWINPAVYDGPQEFASWNELTEWVDTKVAEGVTPWCVALESGAASGWPAADFIDEIVLRQAGPEFHTSWRNGDVPWTAPEIRAAYDTFGELVAPGNVYGDVNSILGTNFANGADALFGDQPQCLLHEQATFMGGIIAGNFPDLVAGEDYDFIPVPDFSTEFAGTRAISGEVLAMFVETPQSVALTKYLSSPEAGTLIAETGRWLSPNRQVASSTYTDPFLGRASELLGEATRSYNLANALMPQAVVDRFWRSGLEYVQEPGDLDRILGELEAVRQQSE